MLHHSKINVLFFAALFGGCHGRNMERRGHNLCEKGISHKVPFYTTKYITDITTRMSKSDNIKGLDLHLFTQIMEYFFTVVIERVWRKS